jgi:hypothetical protein
MIITKVILVCNDNPLYYQFANDIYDVWLKHIQIQPHLFIIAKDKTTINLDFGDRTVQFIEPIPNIPTAFQSQVIRLLLPCLFKDDTLIITDIDMLPLKKKIFKKQIAYINDDIFLKYFHNFQMCYNCAKGKIWSEIFNVNSINDIKHKIIEWFKEYKGIHTTDQIVLQKYLNNYKGRILTFTSYIPNNTSIQRLSTYSDKSIVNKIELNELKKYLDFHMHHIFSSPEYKESYNKIINYLLSP